MVRDGIVLLALVRAGYNPIMARLQVDLPERLKAAAEERASSAGYGSVDNYIASLIEADETAPISDEREAELIKGLQSEPTEEITPEFIDRIKRRARSNRGTAA